MEKKILHFLFLVFFLLMFSVISVSALIVNNDYHVPVIKDIGDEITLYAGEIQGWNLDDYFLNYEKIQLKTCNNADFTDCTSQNLSKYENDDRFIRYTSSYEDTLFVIDSSQGTSYSAFFVFFSISLLEYTYNTSYPYYIEINAYQHDDDSSPSTIRFIFYSNPSCFPKQTGLDFVDENLEYNSDVGWDLSYPIIDYDSVSVWINFCMDGKVCQSTQNVNILMGYMQSNFTNVCDEYRNVSFCVTKNNLGTMQFSINNLANIDSYWEIEYYWYNLSGNPVCSVDYWYASNIIFTGGGNLIPIYSNSALLNSDNFFIKWIGRIQNFLPNHNKIGLSDKLLITSISISILVLILYVSLFVMSKGLHTFHHYIVLLCAVMLFFFFVSIQYIPVFLIVLLFLLFLGFLFLKYKSGGG